MLFIGDRKTGQFQRMINPSFIDCSDTNNCVLFVQDVTGVFFILTFTTHDDLIDCMQTLCSVGRATCLCDVEVFQYPKNTDEHVKEITYKEIEDFEYERK